MSLFPRASTCELLNQNCGNAFWMGAHYAIRNHWLEKAREAGITEDQRQLRVAFARRSHRMFIRFRRSLMVSI